MKINLQNVKKNVGTYITIVVALATVTIGSSVAYNNANKKVDITPTTVPSKSNIVASSIPATNTTTPVVETKPVDTTVVSTPKETTTVADATPSSTKSDTNVTTPKTTNNTSPAKVDTATSATNDAPVDTTPVTPPRVLPKTESRLDINLKTAIPNNGKYKITVEKTEGIAPMNVKYTIEGVNSKDMFWTVVANGTNEISSTHNSKSPTDTTYIDEIGINAYENMPTSLTLYIFVQSSVDGELYYQTFPFTVTSVNMQ